MPIVRRRVGFNRLRTPTTETKHLNSGPKLRRALRAATAALVLGLALPWFPAGVPGALAQDTLRAVAVVNDEVISMLDLFMRTRLAALSSGIELTQQSQSRLQQQVLRRLIDERLQLQEAERLSIAVSDEEVAEALDVPLQSYDGARIDIVHPTPDGYRVLAEALIERLAEGGML